MRALRGLFPGEWVAVFQWSRPSDATTAPLLDRSLAALELALAGRQGAAPTRH